MAEADFDWGKLISAGAQLFSGISAFDSVNDEASLLREQGALTKDDYFRQAALVRDEGKRLRSKQTMQYVSSGVEAVGTPLLVLKETLSRSMARASSYETTGLNYEKLYNRKAQITKKEGQSTLVSDVLKAGAMILPLML
jgi:hypothetical protein